MDTVVGGVLQYIENACRIPGPSALEILQGPWFREDSGIGSIPIKYPRPRGFWGEGT